MKIVRLCFMFVLVIAALLAFAPEGGAAKPGALTASSKFATASADGGTSASQFVSPVGRYRITVPGVGEPAPERPFLPMVVADDLVVGIDRVSVSFQVQPGHARTPDKVAAMIVAPEMETPSEATVMASGNYATVDETGLATLVLVYGTAAADRELDIVWVGYQ